VEREGGEGKGFRERKREAEVLAGGLTTQEVAERRRNFSLFILIALLCRDPILLGLGFVLDFLKESFFFFFFPVLVRYCFDFLFFFKKKKVEIYSVALLCLFFYG
jgi:hypothetical protein